MLVLKDDTGLNPGSGDAVLTGVSWTNSVALSRDLSNFLSVMHFQEAGMSHLRVASASEALPSGHIRAFEKECGKGRLKTSRRILASL